MTKKIKRLYLQEKKRYLKKIVGTLEKPRLSVFRSNKHIYAQLINDVTQETLVASNSLQKDILLETLKKKPSEKAFAVGEKLAYYALKKGLPVVVFDRGARRYHGRIRSLAEGARQKGLNF